MKYYFCLITLLLSMTSQALAAEIPLHFHNSCKVTAIEQMVEWMAGKEFYSIQKIEDPEGKVPSGQKGIFLKVTFDDTGGCQGRQMIANCIPLDEKTLFVELFLTQCKAKPMLKSMILN